jgi:hypothetical protein
MSGQDAQDLAVRVAQLESLIADLEEAVAELAAAGCDDGTPPPTGPPPAGWVDYASAEDWIALAQWVDWLSTVYDLRADHRIRPCWPAHLGVANELAGLHAAWVDAARRGRSQDNDAMAHWHDRWLTPLLTRLSTLYSIASCTSKHEPAVRPPALTDGTLIDVRSAETTSSDEIRAVLI